MTEQRTEAAEGLLAQVQHYLHVVLKWKWIALSFFIVAVVLSVIVSFLMTPKYTATGSLWIDEDPNILPFEEVQGVSSANNLSSHSKLFLSRSLAALTIEKMKLYENPDFAGSAVDKEPVDFSDPVIKEKMVVDFLMNVSVDPVQGTRLVDVSFSNRNPRLAADTLNTLFDEYIDMIVRKRYMASEQASEFLSGQMAALRIEIEEREAELNRYASERDILPLTASETPTVTRLAQMNKELTDATIDRINKLNYYNQLQSAPLGEIPGALPGSAIERLREQYQTLSRTYARRLATLRPEYPEMRQLKSEIDAAAQALQDETQNLTRAAYADYQAALKKEQSYIRELEALKAKAYQANSSSILYNSQQIELENKKALLEALSKRQSETAVSSRLQGLEAINVWVVDKAGYPLKPSFPNKRKNVLIGFLIGLAGGVGLALGIEFLNNTVKTSKDVATATGLPTLGVIPAFELDIKGKGPDAELARLIKIIMGSGKTSESTKKKAGLPKLLGRLPKKIRPRPAKPKQEQAPAIIELIASREPHSAQSESYRSIRTTLLVSSPPGKIKSILFTSPLASEGKSVTVSNLAITLAEANRRVVIVDSDLRRPKQGQIFSLNGGPGLSRYLNSHVDTAQLVRPTNIPNLHLINSGPPPNNPIELLTLDKMDSLVAFLKRSYDFIFFDAPPILVVSDALAVGPMVDGVILVVRGGETPTPALKQAKQKLDAHRLKCFGVILNGVDLVEQDGYYSRRYHQYYKTG